MIEFEELTSGPPVLRARMIVTKEMSISPFLLRQGNAEQVRQSVKDILVKQLFDEVYGDIRDAVRDMAVFCREINYSSEDFLKVDSAARQVWETFSKAERRLTGE